MYSKTSKSYWNTKHVFSSVFDWHIALRRSQGNELGWDSGFCIALPAKFYLPTEMEVMPVGVKN